MGLDGFSMSNLGMYNRLTSAQMANEAEFLAMQGNGSDIKDIEALSNKSGIARKENDYSETGGQAFMGGDTGEGSEEEDLEDLPAPDMEFTDDENDPEHSSRRFEMRINDEANIVELYDNYLETTVHRLSTKDMLNMIKNFDDPAGVLVNKKA